MVESDDDVLDARNPGKRDCVTIGPSFSPCFRSDFEESNNGDLRAVVSAFLLWELAGVFERAAFSASKSKGLVCCCLRAAAISCLDEAARDVDRSSTSPESVDGVIESEWLRWLWAEAADRARSWELGMTRTAGLWVAPKRGEANKRPARSVDAPALTLFEKTRRKPSPSAADMWSRSSW